MGEQWISGVQSEIKGFHPESEAEEWKKKSIYKVPELFAQVKREAYVPKLASFGPYHHGHPPLMPMEQHKRRALVHYLARGNSSVEEVVESLRQQVQLLMDSYDHLNKQWATNKNEFLEMMILDGCFILEVILMLTPYFNMYDWRDPVFCKGHVLFQLMRDILLLENQLPLCVLSTLLAFGGEEIRNVDVNSLVLNFFAQTHIGNKELRNIRGITGLHILDIYRNALLDHGDYSCWSICVPHSVVALRKAGVRFSTSESKGFKDISFSNGVLSLPPIDIDNNTEAILRNLIAFENVRGGHEVTAYAFFMDALIDSEKDVALLRRKGIIRGWSDSDKDTVKLFKNLTKQVPVTLTPDNGVDVTKQLHEYYSRRRNEWRAKWNEWRASFMRSYLRNPWVFMSLLAAFVLLVMTVVQTVYTVLSYYHF